MRIIDYEVSQRPDILIANSKNVQARIKKFYRRDSLVIYPPVDLSSFPTASPRGERKRESIQNGSRIKSGMTDGYFLVLSRLARGKGVDVIIEACGKLALPLKIAGTGPELDDLKKLSVDCNLKPETFLGWVSDEERIKLLQNAKALIVAAEDEDFGITAIEAQAAQTPVIAPASGGFLETVIDQETGLLYGGPGMVTVEALVDALQKFDSSKFDPATLRKNAERFSKERFKKEILELIQRSIKGVD